MTTHQIGDRFHSSNEDGTQGQYDIILGYGGYALQEVATGRNPLWWDADNFISGFDTLEHAQIAACWLDDAEAHSWARQGNDLKQDLFDLKGI